MRSPNAIAPPITPRPSSVRRWCRTRRLLPSAWSIHLSNIKLTSIKQSISKLALKSQVLTLERARQSPAINVVRLKHVPAWNRTTAKNWKRIERFSSARWTPPDKFDMPDSKPHTYDKLQQLLLK